MASVIVSIGKAGQPSANGFNAPVFLGAVRTETITSSGTAASGALTANEGDIAKVFCATAVIASGEGAASASNGVYVEAGVAGYIGLRRGQTVSVIDA
jgi:hypothetical protein